MTSEERRIGRRQRREQKRRMKRLEKELLYDDFDKVFSYRNMRKSFEQIRKGVMWKPSMQRYSAVASYHIQKLLTQLQNGTFRSRGFHEFWINERGKKRWIRAVDTEERNVQRCLCDYCLVPMMEQSFLYDNSATRKGKGHHFTIKRLRKKLVRFFRKHGRNGYILIFDFLGFFESIQHWVAKQKITGKIHDNRLIQLLFHLIDCFGECGLGLGSQISQTLALAVGDGIDHMITEIFRIGASARYMDDGYLIHSSKAYLRECLEKIRRAAEEIGLELNLKKTRIIRLTHSFTILKQRIRILESGKIVMKMCRNNIRNERRKLKKLARKAMNGQLEWHDVYNSLQSWRSGAMHGNNHRTIRNMEKLYTELVFRSEILQEGV